MTKYMVIGITTEEGYKNMKNMTPEEGKSLMTAWYKWKEDYPEQVLDLGSPLMNGIELIPEGANTPTTSNVSGFMMIQAENREEAIKLLKASPLYSYGKGQQFELFECMNMG